MPAYLTRNRALLTLNDHCGHEVEVTVDLKSPLLTFNDDRGQEVEVRPSIISAKGVLRHWRDDERALDVWANFAREEITGLYDVGESGASFDITGFARAELLKEDDEPYGLAFHLGDGAVLNVVWGLELD